MIDGVNGSWRLLERNEKKRLVALSSLRLSVNFLDIVGILLIAGAISTSTGASLNVPGLGSRLGIETSLGLLLGAGLAFSLKTILGAFVARKVSMVLAALEVQASERILQQFFLNGLAQLKKLSPEDLKWSVLRATEFAFSRILGQAINLVAEASLAIMIFSLMLIFDWRTAIAVSLYFALILLAFQNVTKRSLEKFGRDTAASSTAVAANIAALTVAFREISVVNLLSNYIEKVVSERQVVARGGANEQFLQSLPRLIVELALILGAITVAAWQISVEGDASDLVIIGVMLMGGIRIMSALLPLQRSFAAIKFFAPQALQAQLLLSEVPRNAGPEIIATGSPKIQLTPRSYRAVSVETAHLEFSHTVDCDGEDSSSRGGYRAIDGITLSVAAGEYVALLGESGAGKSTLVDLVLGLQLPASGQVLLNGIPPREFIALSPGAIGYVPQKPGVVPGSLAQNIALGVGEIDLKQVASVVERAELTKLVEGLPDGIRTDLGPHADNLSGGEIQRIGLARALYTNPGLLILDEATSSLDAATEYSVTETLEKMRGSVTIVVIAHRLSTVQRVDTAHLISGGKLVASGSFEHLKRENPIVKKYVNLMSFNDAEWSE